MMSETSVTLKKLAHTGLNILVSKKLICINTVFFLPDFLRKHIFCTESGAILFQLFFLSFIFFVLNRNILMFKGYFKEVKIIGVVNKVKCW